MALELFANNSITSVVSGGATTPAPGTAESWTVASSAAFPAANSGGSPPTQFHVADPAAPTEMLTVTNVSSNTWTVVRGAEGTTPVSHAPGFSVEHVITKQVLSAFPQSVNNLSDLPSASTARTNLGLGTAAVEAVNTTAGTIAWPGTQAAGSAGQVADAGHVHPPSVTVINVKNPLYGAVGNGTTDDTSAIQAAINAVTGAAAPATNTRVATAALYFPPGTYKITSDLIIRSVQGFRIQGSGVEHTFFKLSGTGFTQAGIFIDGSVWGEFEGFTLIGDGTEQVTDGIRLDWTAAAQRSTSANHFHDITLRNLKCVVGVSIEGNGSRQVDGTRLDNLVITGGFNQTTWASTGNWQKGIAFGNGTFGNNYNHVGTGVHASCWYHGYDISASSFALFGAEPALNFIDISILPAVQSTFKNIQSQNSNEFLVQVNSFAPAPITIEDVYYTTQYLNASSYVMELYAGTFYIQNVSASTLVAAPGGGSYVNGIIRLYGQSSTRPCEVTLANVVLNNTRTAGILPTNNAVNATVLNFINYNPTSGTYTLASGDQFSTFNGTTWYVPPLLDATASDIQPLGTQTAGAVGKAADAGHIHGFNGALGSNLVTKSANYTLTGADGTVLVTTGSTNTTMTLPTAVGRLGQMFTVIKADSGTGTLTVATTSSQTINGATTYTTIGATQYGRVRVQSDGANWWVLNA